MNYCIAASDRFESIPDPYFNDRICFRSKYQHLDITDLRNILKDDKFLFIMGDVIVFDN